MDLKFKDAGTEDVAAGRDTKAARALLPRSLRRIALRKLDLLNSAVRVADLRVPPGNQLEVLRGDRAGQYSIRINDRYRICFRWEYGIAIDVEIVDYH